LTFQRRKSNSSSLRHRNCRPLVAFGRSLAVGATEATLFYDLRQINNFAQITQFTQYCMI
jgi:hypothetical protein